MTIGIIIQARTGSKRLPQKMILPFYKDIGILEALLINLKNAKLETPIILATTSNPSDDIIESIANKQNIKLVRGNENNVLSRFIYAAEKYNIQKIIRVCADNPFLDINALKYQIDSFRNFNVDYWCYSKSDKTPTIKTHYGFWAEGVTLDALKNVDEYTREITYQEHVTNYIYTHPERFNIYFKNIDKTIENETNIRLTIDTNEDFEIAKKLYLELINNKIPFESNRVISFLKLKPEWILIMKSQIIANSK